ncbi:Glutathione S-transferase 1, isoform D [Amphibalanus amphitrite]|uniref:Glutathione S-transferase 1, isoform D n=1 Tax=Amphibalanus amphitrite TaxID=1232801 RepID=A0A6A4X3L1_AMPAM|nr:glutathione S-transferase 1-1-like [Amphibalanus amphitrite]KAF0313877.1 Glutathione S-transferase 1, isoform D [Amphibalanus amphitrite]
MSGAAIDLYHTLWSPPSRAVRMIGRAVGAQFNLIECNLMAGEHMKPEYLKMNPLHTVPTINDNGFYVWESRAIGHYLINKFAPGTSLIPTDLRRRALYDQMLFFDYSLLFSFSTMTRKVLLGAKQLDRSDVKRCHECLRLLNSFLSESEYLVGDEITMVDYSAAASIAGCQTGMFGISGHPHTQRWFNKVRNEIDGFDEINEPGVQMIQAFMSMATPPDPKPSKL